MTQDPLLDTSGGEISPNTCIIISPTHMLNHEWCICFPQTIKTQYWQWLPASPEPHGDKSKATGARLLPGSAQRAPIHQPAAAPRSAGARCLRESRRSPRRGRMRAGEEGTPRCEPDTSSGGVRSVTDSQQSREPLHASPRTVAHLSLPSIRCSHRSGAPR